MWPSTVSKSAIRDGSVRTTLNSAKGLHYLRPKRFHRQQEQIINPKRKKCQRVKYKHALNEDPISEAGLVSSVIRMVLRSPTQFIKASCWLAKANPQVSKFQNRPRETKQQKWHLFTLSGLCWAEIKRSCFYSLSGFIYPSNETSFSLIEEGKSFLASVSTRLLWESTQ